jgi:hypothetical protein
MSSLCKWWILSIFKVEKVQNTPEMRDLQVYGCIDIFKTSIKFLFLKSSNDMMENGMMSVHVQVPWIR